MKGNTVLLILIFLLLCGTLYLSYTNFQYIQILRLENTNLWVKIDSVQQICNNQPQKQRAATVPAPQITENALLRYLIKSGKDEAKAATGERTEQKMAVSSKYRLEDRYVMNKVQEPEISGNQQGEVVLNISVDWTGDVKSAKLQSATGITDEDVIEACKKAALKTHFNSNLDLRDTKQSGTITYIFSAEYE